MAIAVGALLMTNWEPMSVPATFEVVGSEVRKERRTIAFAVQSIQKRVPKMIGPAIGGLVLGAVGYWLNAGCRFADLVGGWHCVCVRRLGPPRGRGRPPSW